MNSTKVKATLAATLASALIAAPVMAATAGTIERGDIYKVKNVTKSGAYTNSATADKCDVLQFQVGIHNGGPDPITNVNVKATLPTNAVSSFSSQVTVHAANANPTTVTDTAAVNLSTVQSVSYVENSTELLDTNGAVLSTLPNTITGAGVNISTVGVSNMQERFVRFKAKVNCPTPPVVTPPPPTPPTPPVTPPATPVTPQAALPETGPEAALAGMAGTGALGYAVVAYRRSKKALADSLLNRN